MPTLRRLEPGDLREGEDREPAGDAVAPEVGPDQEARPGQEGGLGAGDGVFGSVG